ncbi:hypothetical protein G7Y89_g12563 [Cudoniella acicularis]|uniref:Uncharacterized protein n=1 Tax=Cudoniella acicularis TaxID=354080 RepID=A0A8H4VX88_9HELO|nr:hypothetical protein G7Y89_g12563 [Cudoniella acicularis]
MQFTTTALSLLALAFAGSATAFNCTSPTFGGCCERFLPSGEGVGCDRTAAVSLGAVPDYLCTPASGLPACCHTIPHVAGIRDRNSGAQQVYKRPPASEVNLINTTNKHFNHYNHFTKIPFLQFQYQNLNKNSKMQFTTALSILALSFTATAQFTCPGTVNDNALGGCCKVFTSSGIGAGCVFATSVGNGQFTCGDSSADPGVPACCNATLNCVSP